MANVVREFSGSYSTVLPSAARTATPDTFEYEFSRTPHSVVLVTDATAIAATPSVTVSLLGVDRASGKTWTILAGAAITAVSTQVLKVGPGLTAAANSVANDVIPPVLRISAVHGDADSITYSIGLSVVE
jgi:hypothetical protein